MGGGGDDESEMRFKHREEEPRVSRIEATSMPMYAKADPFFSSTDWDPAVSAMVSSNAAGGFSSSHYPSLVMDSGFSHYPSGSGYADMSSSLLPYGNPSDCSGQIGHVLGSDKKSGCVGRLIRSGESHEDHQISDDGVLGGSPSRKRRQPEMDSAPSSQWNKKAVDKYNQNDVQKGSNVEDQRQKKPESEQNKESSQSGEAPKQDYIHVRARRGQATNSHSLAERVRREKISERMRLLQELVPGCNKITGKAVMLDEIINYVQSLQQQVEFLSMKLATVNPEINMDIDRIIAKDLMHSRDRNVSTLGLATGLNPSQYGVIPGTIQNIPATNPQYNPMSQTVLSSELQSLYQMGFVPNPSTMDSFSPNGRLKPEL